MKLTRLLPLFALLFDFYHEDNQWHHKGSSSKGEPINEIWTRGEKLGI